MKVILEKVDKSCHVVKADTMKKANKIKDLFQKLHSNKISLTAFQKQLSLLESESISVKFENGEVNVYLEVEPKAVKKSKSVKSPQIFALYSIEWIEKERGMGMRPDGFSFHVSEEEANNFVKKYESRLPKEVPDEYSAPLGKPSLLEVSESLYNYVMNNGNVWLHIKNAKAYKAYDASQLNK